MLRALAARLASCVFPATLSKTEYPPKYSFQFAQQPPAKLTAELGEEEDHGREVEQGAAQPHSKNGHPHKGVAGGEAPARRQTREAHR